MTSPRFLYGKLDKPVDVLIMAQLENGNFVVLKRDPSFNAGPYFGPAGDLDFISFKLNGNVLLTPTREGLVFSSALDAPLLVESSGQFDYEYTTEYAEGVPLTAGELLTMSVNDEELIFMSKNIAQEIIDRESFELDPSDYEPTYQEEPVVNYFFVTEIGFDQDINNCLDPLQNGPYVSYSNKVGPIYFTSISFCQFDITNPLCPPGEVCGNISSGVACVGACTEKSCEAVSDGVVACTDEPSPISPNVPLVQQPWFLPVFISLIVFIGIACVVLA